MIAEAKVILLLKSSEIFLSYFYHDFNPFVIVKTYYGPEEYKTVKNPVVTTGTFDGVHLGHRKIIARMKEIAVSIGGETVLLTFSPHPRLVLFPEDNNLRLLNTPEEKTELLEKEGIDHLVILPFTREFSRLSSAEYVRDILVNSLGTKKLIVGYNHQFGRNREGSLEHMKEFGYTYGFEVEEISALVIDGIKVSSTKIRECLQQGDIETAARYSGYDYPLSGMVVHSEKIGQSIGFPTANIVPSDRLKQVPGEGVYAVKVIFSGTTYNGMLNIGTKPTVNTNNKRSIEVHIFDFNQEIYGRELKVIFKKKLRDEKKFASLDELKKQLESDKQKSVEILR